MSDGWSDARRWLTLAGLSVAVAALFLLSVTTGAAGVPIGAALAAVWDGLAGRAQSSTAASIVWNWRLPGTITAVVAGAALAVAGAQMQTLFRNPLAGPDVLGVSSGASLGVALLVLASAGAPTAFDKLAGSLGPWALVAAAGAGAMSVLLLALALARSIRDPVTLLVLGLMLGSLTTGAVGLLVSFSSQDRLQAYVAWTLGSFAGSWENLRVFAPTALVLTVAACLGGKTLNALQLGPDYARSLGVRVHLAVGLLLGSAALLTGSVTAFCGPVAFLGVATPHVARALLGGGAHRWLLPAAALA
ncbi:MAG TPA: iron ABC transporter permease, partial [Planctomycetia bacterium]|nr:iron ABC transporter permease [Planctomycetia bacterium]